MEIIRTKRATSTAGGPAAGSQPKSKYRKRSVSIYHAYGSVERKVDPVVSGCGPASGRPPQGNVIPAIYARLPSGGVDPTAQGHCAMRVVCVSSTRFLLVPNILIRAPQIMRSSCAKGISRLLLRDRHPVLIWRRCELQRELLTSTSYMLDRKRRLLLLKPFKCNPPVHLPLR
jgi:hypothetical protein